MNTLNKKRQLKMVLLLLNHWLDISQKTTEREDLRSKKFNLSQLQMKRFKGIFHFFFDV